MAFLTSSPCSSIRRRIYDSASQENTSATNFSYPTIHLPREEYAMVMHELATNLTKEEHSYPIAVKHIRNYTYRVEILGFGNYRIIGKWKIPTRRRNKRK